MARAERRLARRFVRDRLAVAGLLVLVVFAALAVCAPLIARFDPAAANPTLRLAGPTPEHPLGTDNLGRDLLCRLLVGSRWSLGTAGLATRLIMTLGLTIGSTAGYYGGRLDQVVGVIVDVLLAFPSLVLALAIAGTLGPGIVNVMLGMVAVWWVGYARVVRGLVLSLRERQFVEAARCLGATDRLRDRAPPFGRRGSTGDGAGDAGNGRPDPGNFRVELSRSGRAAADTRMGSDAERWSPVPAQRPAPDDLPGAGDQPGRDWLQPAR